ncbi:UDP-N-acetylenolpyruvoylglucosamine reductase [Desulfamplus magnetovallimortis]|uniref:UDP-N-acetylenolpyruvoylglucosamine reductase n=1 Tax=Desulfamplus magnetovallimortis TaxID=1246637 RepID=A0A1W1HDW0_9BACT|nr:UDP-N-acetylmuramate dehydrogenase [Desulfamplus magnetovallimortis]SLM30684.1 UDP-N-acetylenolpyruvoylglucosamine reductase [Desulfamplus magnetovallimortis]
MKSCNDKKLEKDIKFPLNLPVGKNVMMKSCTSFKIGGPADYFARPANSDELKQILEIAGENFLQCTIMGSGTNILVRDKGIRGLVLSLAGMKDEIEINDRDGDEFIVSTSAGTRLSTLCKRTMAWGLGDLSFAAGIPGTVGGAVMMNAGTGMGTMSDYLYSIDMLKDDGTVEKLHRSQLVFSHRKTQFPSLECDCASKNSPRSPMMLKASFLMKKEEKSKIIASWQTLMEKRKHSQPHGVPSAGCFYKNPQTGESAGALIDKAGLKKHRVGDAMISDIHANFIVNMGNATAKDILSLNEIVKAKIKDKFGITLYEEVILKGE